MTLGERIKQRRTELGWTQDVLAQRAKISKGFLSDLENNKRNMSADTLLDVAKELGLSLDYLMTGADTDPAMNERFDFPPALAELAKRLDLSFPHLLMLLQMRRQILANRSSAKKVVGDDDFDWPGFYQSVKKYL
jgi:transcriptional regulator with XRE-family HTH domain